MRIGTIVLVLVAIIMGFGFLFSNNINLQQDLQAAQNRINETMQQNKLLEEQLNNEMAKNAMLQKATESLSQQKLLLDAQVRQMQAEDAQLKDQNAQLQNQINTAVAISPLLTILRNINARALVLGLFVPLLPISLAGNLLNVNNV